jgi:hypothetical protein
LRPANAGPAAQLRSFPDRGVPGLFYIGRHVLFHEQAVAGEAVRRGRHRVDVFGVARIALLQGRPRISERLALGLGFGEGDLLAGGIAAARAEVRTQWVEYKQGDTPLRGYLAYDDAVTGKRPGVLLAHSRSGMSDEVAPLSEVNTLIG